MSAGDDTGTDIHELLAEAGAQWRARQVFGPVAVPSGAINARRRVSRSISALAGRLIGAAAVAAIALAVVAVAPRPERPSGVGFDQPASSLTPPATSALATRLSASSTPGNYSVTPATDPEAASLRIIEAVNGDPVNFGGVYIDEAGGLVIQYVGANAGRAAVEEVLGPDVSVRWEKVDRSQAELMRILRQIRDRNLDGVSAISIDTLNNQVEVRVDPGQADALSPILESEYGDAVAVESAPPFVVQRQ